MMKTLISIGLHLIIFVFLFNEHVDGVFALEEYSFKQLSTDQRAISPITVTTRVTSVTSGAILCTNSNTCDVFNLVSAVGNVWMCELVRFDETGDFTDEATWRVFAGNVRSYIFLVNILVAKCNLVMK